MISMNKLLSFLFRRSQCEYDVEFCPRCDANLTLQRGYRNDLPYWECKGCGEMLINPNIDTETNVVWLCDECGAMLNCADRISGRLRRMGVHKVWLC